MNSKRHFYSGATQKRRAHFLVAGLFLIASVFYGQRSDAKEPTLPILFTVGNRTASAILPQGWKVETQDTSNDPSAPNFAVTSPIGEVIVYCKSLEELKILRDRGSPMPRLLADRFAQTWKLPLYQWSTPSKIVMRDTFRAGSHHQHHRYIASGYSDGLEFVISARVSARQNLVQTRKIVTGLLASMKFASGDTSPLLNGLRSTVDVKPVIGTIDPGIVEVDGKRLRLPKSWATYDMILPMLITPRISQQSTNQLELVYIGPDPQINLNLSVEWLSSHQTQVVRQKYLSRWQNLLNRPVPDHPIENLAKPADSRVIYKKRIEPMSTKFLGKADRMKLIYLSGTANLFGSALIKNQKEEQQAQEAFEALRQQLLNN